MRRWCEDYSRRGETDNRKEEAPPERGASEPAAPRVGNAAGSTAGLQLDGSSQRHAILHSVARAPDLAAKTGPVATQTLGGIPDRINTITHHVLVDAII